MIFHSHNR